MRNKFSELIDAGVASFHYEPIASSTPEQCPLCRLYNAYWGAATETHMGVTGEGRLLITGKFLSQDPELRGWNNLLYSRFWGTCALDWAPSGFLTLSELLASQCLKAVPTTHNGELGIELVDCECEECEPDACPVCACDVYVTSESRIPHPVAEIANPVMLKQIVKDHKTARELCEALNESVFVSGMRWHTSNGKLCCALENKFIILQ